MSLKSQINSEKCPKHVAIIMDGNGRWAQQQGEMRLFGHNSGVEAVRDVLKGCVEVGVKYLTLYAFSTENWNRPQDEVDGLMNLLVDTISNEVGELNENGVRLLSIGDPFGLPNECRLELEKAKEATKHNTKVDLVLALNYSARWEMLDAVKKVAEQVRSGTLTLDEINDEKFASFLSTKDIPDPELIIRTSGEYRLSNFLLWQAAYSELYFTDVLWPDFDREELYKAILNYQSRERRFGMVSEQLNNDYDEK